LRKNIRFAGADAWLNFGCRHLQTCFNSDAATAYNSNFAATY
jgi:hypothetical protein